MLTTDESTYKPYPRLTAAQKDHMLRQVALYFAAMDWIRAGHQARDFVYHGKQREVTTKGEQLELFSHYKETIVVGGKVHE